METLEFPALDAENGKPHFNEEILARDKKSHKHKRSSRDKENNRYMEEILTKIRKLEEKIEAKRDGGSATQEASEFLAVQGELQSGRKVHFKMKHNPYIRQSLSLEVGSHFWFSSFRRRSGKYVTQVTIHEQNIESDGERSTQDADKQSEGAVPGGDSELISHNLSGIAATSQDKVEVPHKPAEEPFVLDEETIKLLGDDPAANKQAELKLNADVASRVTNWPIRGLPKELKEGLLSKFPKNGDCYLEEPELNEEIAVTLNETAIKQDNHFKELHNVIGSALSASSSAVAMLIEEDGQRINKNQLLERVLGSAQLLAELFYTVSVARKAYIINLRKL